MCNCHSQNHNTGTVPEVALNPNKYFQFKKPHRPVGIDACIAPQIKALWENGIWTHSCCCGHNKEQPHIVIGENEDPEYVKFLLQSNAKDWKILQLQNGRELVEV